MTKTYDTILFDADGTLLDFERSEKEALIEALSEIGVVADETAVTTYSAINDALWKALERGEVTKDRLKILRFEQFFESYGILGDAADMARRYMIQLSQKGYTLAGAIELCERLSQDVRLYIITNGVDFIQKERFARSGLAPYFADRFISDAIGYQKPDPRFFEAVASAIPEFKKERALVIGDSLTSDIRGGIGFALDTCWYNPKEARTPDDLLGKITYTVRSFDEIEELILGGER